MALNLKNPEVERLATELATLTGDSKTEVVRKALLEKKSRVVLSLGKGGRGERLTRFLESEIWPNLPEGASRRLSKQEEEALIGYGEQGEPV